MRLGRRALVAAAGLPLLLLLVLLPSACGQESSATQQRRTVTLVGQNFTEADVLIQLYKRLLEEDGFRTTVSAIGARDVYLDQLEDGRVQVAADYLSSFADELNRRVNGTAVAPVGSPDATATLAQLASLGADRGITPLTPARAEGGVGYAVTRAFARRHHLETLSDLGRSGVPVALAAATDCATRTDCARGLQRVYGVSIAQVKPFGLAAGANTQALAQGTAQLAQVSNTDGTLGGRHIVILEDDRHWQNAENVVPVVNSQWLEDNPKAQADLDRLADVLTTADLRVLNARVDAERVEAGQVAEEYLEQKGLI